MVLKALKYALHGGFVLYSSTFNQIKNTNQQHEHHERKTNPLQSNSRTDSVHVTGILYLDIHKYSSSVREIWQSMVRFRSSFEMENLTRSALYDQPKIGLDGSGMSDTYCAFGFFVTGKEARLDLGKSYLIGNVYFSQQNLDISFLIRGSKRVPIATVLLVAFCSVNGTV